MFVLPLFGGARPSKYFGLRRRANSAHPRDRMHPSEEVFYRTDKGFHFLTSQIIVDHLGLFCRVTVGLDHNNDQGMTNLSGRSSWVDKNKIRVLLADLQYKRPALSLAWRSEPRWTYRIRWKPRLCVPPQLEWTGFDLLVQRQQRHESNIATTQRCVSPVIHQC